MSDVHHRHSFQVQYLGAYSLILAWPLLFNCGICASSLDLAGDFCLIALGWNAPLECRCSGSLSLFVVYFQVLASLFLNICRSIYLTCGSGLVSFAVEVTLSRCNVRGLLSSCDRGDILQFWWVGSSLIVPLASLSLWHRPPLKFRRGLGAPLSLQGASSGGSLWGGCSLYLLFGGS